MAVTAAGLLSDLAVARKTLNEWECGPITIDVCNSSSNDITKSINFTETIGYQKYAPRSSWRNDDNCYWLNAEWNRNDNDIRQNTIIPYFVAAASYAGCRIQGSWFPKKYFIRFSCFLGRKNYSNYATDYYTSKVRPQKKLKKSSSSPVERLKKSQRPPTYSLEPDEGHDLISPHESDTTCKFKFSVYWDGDT